MRIAKNTLGIVRFAILLFAAVFFSNCTKTEPISKDEFQKIQTGFVTPHDSNTVWCYWYWINDDISKEGITKDLEAMKEVGIGAAFIGNINPPEVDGPVPMLSEEWWDCMVHAVNEGKRIGVDIGTFNCPGWSQSGGPWVKPEMAMRYLASSETVVKGPGKVKIKLQQPKELFQDVYVLAFPAIQAEKTKLTNVNSKISSIPQIQNINYLLDGDTSTVAFFSPEVSEYSIEIKSDKAIEARNIQLFPGKERLSAQ
ncbi:MAG TPA: glycosyl hydrolase, partial [Draconibacterium sp.]|nr:glycosyl hydrolase [Draconibacterium sp.]